MRFAVSLKYWKKKEIFVRKERRDVQSASVYSRDVTTTIEAGQLSLEEVYSRPLWNAVFVATVLFGRYESEWISVFPWHPNRNMSKEWGPIRNARPKQRTASMDRGQHEVPVNRGQTNKKNRRRRTRKGTLCRPNWHGAIWIKIELCLVADKCLHHEQLTSHIRCS